MAASGSLAPCGLGQRRPQVARTTVSIDVSPDTGNQIPSARDVTLYQGDPGDSFEEIYDEYASDRTR